MQGHANVSTLPAMAADPKSASLYRRIIGKNGEPIVDKNVWVASLGCGGDEYSDMFEQIGNLTTGFGASRSEIGPELAFGLTMERKLRRPILIIKASWGGRSLMTDFRPPLAGPRVYSDALKAKWARQGKNVAETIVETNAQCGVFYHHMIDYVKRILGNIQRVDPDYTPAQGYRLAGFVWFQGWNDMVDGDAYPNRSQPGGYGAYAELEKDLVQNVRQDLASPNLPAAIGVMGVGGVSEGTKPDQEYFRAAQVEGVRLLGPNGHAKAVATAKFWDDRLSGLNDRRQAFNDQFNKWADGQPKMSQAEREQAYADQLAKAFTPPGIEAMKGISNYGFHYLGSAKTLCSIGEALANALQTLSH